MTQMTPRNRRWIAGVWLLCAVSIALLFCTGILNTQRVWTDLKQDYAGGDNVWRLEDGDAYGTVASGPYIALPEGMYRIKWQIEGDGENRLTLACTNNAEITPTEITVNPDQWQDEAWFEIKEPTHNFYVTAEFDSGTWMQVHNIRLYSPEYTDSTFAASALLIFLCALLTMYIGGRLTPTGMKETALLALAVLLASQPYLSENLPVAYDTYFHTARIMNLADGLRSGQLPVLAGGFSYNGYGAMTSVFYPDLLLYPWALMILGGASITFVISSLVVVINALTALCMCIAGSRLTGSRQAGLCAGVLYLFSIYRLEDIYVRLMVGEMLAMAFAPLFVLGLYEVVLGERKRWPLLALGATLVFRSHMLTTVLCALVALAFAVIWFGKILKEGRLREIMLACAVTLLINLNQIVPLVMCYAAGVNTSVMQFGFVNEALEVATLLEPGRYIGMALLIGMAAYIAADWKEGYTRQVLRFSAVGGALCMILATNLVPWSHVSLLTGGLVDTLQFPWRFLLLTSLCFALCGGAGMARLFGAENMKAAVAALALGVVCAMPYLGDMAPYDAVLEFGMGAKTIMNNPEYQIEGTSVGDTRSRAVLTDGDVQMTEYHKDGTRIDAKVAAGTDASLSFPLFGFPGYEARLNGEKVDWRLGENNRLTVDIAAGSEGTLEIRYVGKPVWKALDLLSAGTALALTGWVVHEKRKKRMA